MCVWMWLTGYWYRRVSARVLDVHGVLLSLRPAAPVLYEVLGQT